MKPVLLAIALLLTAAGVGAAETPATIVARGECHLNDDGSTASCLSKDGTWDMYYEYHGDPTCWQKMEAAMRAMEPWIVFYAQGSHVRSVEIAKEVEASWKQWNAAKACWREQP